MEEVKIYGSKIIPRRGDFTIVTTSSMWPNDIGLVTEVNSKVIEVRYTGERIGKFNIENNNFQQIIATFEKEELPIDEKIEEIVKAFNSASDGKNTFPESIEPREIKELLKELN
jgi:hypothetical protein